MYLTKQYTNADWLYTIWLASPSSSHQLFHDTLNAEFSQISRVQICWILLTRETEMIAIKSKSTNTDTNTRDQKNNNIENETCFPWPRGEMEKLLWQELCFIMLVLCYIETNVSVHNALLPMHAYVLWSVQRGSQKRLVVVLLLLLLLFYLLYYLSRLPFLCLSLLCRIFK